MSLAPATFDDLGVHGCFYLASLLDAQARRRCVSPTKALTHEGLATLVEQGVIELATPTACAERPTAWQETPMEGLGWRLTWTAYRKESLFQALEDYLEGVPRDEGGTSIRVQLWQQLAQAESQSFLEQQLVKHGLPAMWSQDLGYVRGRSQHHLTLSQWRYVAWAAVRKGASHLLTQMPNPDVLREVIYSELTRRAAIVATGQWGTCALPPYHPWPGSSQGAVFVRRLGQMDWGYWNFVPSDEALRHVWTSEAARDLVGKGAISDQRTHHAATMPAG